MKTKNNHGPVAKGGLGEMVVKELKGDPAFREEYLKDLLIEQDLPMLTLSLKYVVDALGGPGKLSRETGLSRQNLYKALSGKQRPDFSTLLKILNFAGYELSLKKRRPGPVSVVEIHENRSGWKSTKPSGKEAAEIRRGRDNDRLRKTKPNLADFFKRSPLYGADLKVKRNRSVSRGRLGSGQELSVDRVKGVRSQKNK